MPQTIEYSQPVLHAFNGIMVVFGRANGGQTLSQKAQVIVLAFLERLEQDGIEQSLEVDRRAG